MNQRANILKLQNLLLQNKWAIKNKLEQYPGFINLGIGLKEKGDQLTDIICYRVYVIKKLPKESLIPSQIIPKEVDGFLTDVIERGKFELIAADSSKQRPIRGGIQIKSDHFLGENERGIGTLGAIARLNDGTNKLVGLTCEHVVRLNPGENIIGREVGQPRKVVCCCCCTQNIIGKVLNAQNDADVDCAIIELDEDVIEEINSQGTEKEILEIGNHVGTDEAVVLMDVRKRGAGTGLTLGQVIEIGFDGSQILIAPSIGFEKFADFGDSGSVVINSFDKIIGLLWGVKRDGRMDGVVSPIGNVLTAMNITLPQAPVVTATIAIDPSDSKTHEIPSILPPGPDVKQHFVTAKGDGDIILKATFDLPVDNDQISWISSDLDTDIIYPAIGTDNSTAKIRRNTANGLKSLVALFVNGDLLKKVNVWIVWSTGRSIHPGNIETEIAPNFLNIIGRYGTKVGNTFTDYGFEFTIQPAEIIPDTPTDDVPDFSGSRTIMPPNVSPEDTGVYQKVDNPTTPEDESNLALGANNKWDVTRRLKLKVLNPNNVTLSGPAQFNTNYLNYPSNSVVGNDDRGTGDEKNDPYTNNKKLFSADSINTPLETASGNNGDEVEYRIHFQEFARLQIGNEWYNISPPISWRHHIKFKKIAGKWTDNGSDIALDNSGF